MSVDPVILALFGPAPTGVDLSESPVHSNNAAVAVLLVIAACAVLLRFAARRITGNPLQKDDWAIVVALLFTAGSAGMSFAIGSYGAGKHVWAVTGESLSTATKASEVDFIGSRIFSATTFSFRLNIWIAGTITLLYPLTLAIGMANCCKPVSFYWERFAGNSEDSCPLDVGTFFVVLAIINVILDAYILTIPIPQILNLQMSTRKKISICGLMLLGSFVCGASCVRIYYLRVFSTATDITSLMGPVSVWSAIEPSIGILSACLPNMRPLYVMVRKKCSTSYASRSSTKRSDPGPMTRRRFQQLRSHGNVKVNSQHGQEEDELELTKPNKPSRSFVSSGDSNDGIHDGGIVVQSEIVVQHS
ncbi:uncharacterized protein JN550_013148 [Neoarthrinium moseri]|uniref:uncharacterized protein n=1 Tax=Neoarthrinium moseri TaxID=1658444 RepID=UPI001FDB5CF2|nr:uncharacterized protein JN550_013148 [Neoarthrinium moseri]KAI1857579.1 hypothetical protein JN550_013148 [Neoarthrinium moseri]